MTDTSPGGSNVASSLTSPVPDIKESINTENDLLNQAKSNTKPRKASAKHKSKARVIMKRLAPRLPKLICYIAFGLLILFALKKLNELSTEKDRESRETTRSVFLVDITDEVTPARAELTVRRNVVPTEESVSDLYANNNSQKKMAEQTNQKRQQDQSLRQKRVKEGPPKDGILYTPKVRRSEVHVRTVEHLPPDDYRYRVRNSRGSVLNAGKEFDMKRFPRHMAEIILEKPEEEDESDPARAVIVTGASTEIFNEVLQLTQSIQKYLPKTLLVIYDVGLQTHEKLLFGTGCNVEIREVFLSAFPFHVQNAHKHNWRPFVMQLALAEFHFVVWADPKVRLVSGRIEPILKMASKNGISLLANPSSYSTYTVTHPAMYDYIPSNDPTKFKTEPHLELKLLAIHSSAKVQETFMKWLALCAGEIGCLSPPDANDNCKTPLRPKQYANCHRYEESAINILLKNIYDHDIDKFYIRNLIAVPALTTKAERTLKKCPRRPHDL